MYIFAKHHLSTNEFFQILFYFSHLPFALKKTITKAEKIRFKNLTDFNVYLISYLFIGLQLIFWLNIFL